MTSRFNHAPGALSIVLVTLNVVGCNVAPDTDAAADAAVSVSEASTAPPLTDTDGAASISATLAPAPSAEPATTEDATHASTEPWSEPASADSTAADSTSTAETSAAGPSPTSTGETPTSSGDAEAVSQPGALSASSDVLATSLASSGPFEASTESASATEAVTTDEPTGDATLSAGKSTAETLAAETVTADSTRGAATSEPAPSEAVTSDALSSLAPAPIDWLNPPGGQAAFGLSQDYAALDWVDVAGATLDNTYDASSCTRVYDHVQGGLGFIECEGGSEQWSCRCYTDSQTYDWAYLPTHFVDTSADTGEACRLGAAICLTELPGPTGCYDSGRWEGHSAQSCVRDDWCEYGVGTPYGGLSHAALMPFITCSIDYESPVSAYVCGTSGAPYRIRGLLDAVPDRSIQETCDVGGLVFHYGVDPDSEGEPLCEPVGAVTVEVSNGQEQYCSARYQCTRPATALGEAVSLAYDEQTVGCSRREDGWGCWCGDEPSSYTWPGVDGVIACNNALDECMSHPLP